MDSKLFREALGSFGTGICVVTTVPKESPAIGMTINSFASVSLDPALVLWSIQTNSDCYQAFDESDSFAISILNSDQEAISNLYASKGSHAIQSEHSAPGELSPTIAGSLADFQCKVWARYPGGDHTIIVGEVIGINVNEQAAPLLFYRGKYSLLG